MKIAIVLGTRPEIIKMASVMDEIQNKGHELLLIHTGQHYDKEMSENFFLDLKLPKPNYNIHVGSGSHGKQTGKIYCISNCINDKLYIGKTSYPTIE